ncbi:MAG: hypothetical protein MJ106_02660 [Lentisphaeria bacterium]|nr:hypothetical protein [Lentisphaeria bacterium]
MDSRTNIHIVLPLGIALLAVGGVAMFLLGKHLKRLLSRELGERELPAEWVKQSPLMTPVREVLFGSLIVFAVPIFTKFCLGGTASEMVSAVVGYITAGLCALGCFSRQRRDMDELGMANESGTVVKTLGGFAGSLAVFLWGQLTLMIAIYFAVMAIL